MAHCPRCGSVLDFEDEELVEGEVFSCPDCEVNLEVVARNPVQLTLAGGEKGKEDGEDDLGGEDEISDNGNLR